METDVPLLAGTVVLAELAMCLGFVPAWYRLFAPFRLRLANPIDPARLMTSKDGPFGSSGEFVFVGKNDEVLIRTRLLPSRTHGFTVFPFPAILRLRAVGEGDASAVEVRWGPMGLVSWLALLGSLALSSLRSGGLSLGDLALHGVVGLVPILFPLGAPGRLRRALAESGV